MTRANPRQERTLRRQVGRRPVKESFLIICEGTNTEPEYFHAFRLTSANVKAIGKGIGTTSLVKEAITIKHQEDRKGKRYDHYWVVFDKDEYTDADFNGAIKLAQDEGFQVAYSNQAFEYWLLLHFNLYQGAIPRTRYAEMLSRLLGSPYTKKSGMISRVFNLLYPKTDTAISNAKVTARSFTGSNPAKEESSTTVYQLVEQLMKFR